MTRQMEKESIKERNLSTRENGKMTYLMGRVNLKFIMKVSMKDNFKRVRKMEKEKLFFFRT